MIEVEVIGDKAIELDLKEFPANAGRALVRALNRAIKSGQTLTVREVAKDMGIAQKEVRRRIKVREATLERPEASLAASLKRIPLIEFAARQTAKGVTYKAKGGGRSLLQGAFIATTRTQTAADAEPSLEGSGGSHTGVFKRVGKKRLPIKQRYGPSLGHVFAKFRKAGLDRAQEVFQKNFDHELKFSTVGAPDVQ